jgi:hypothetical protein
MTPRTLMPTGPQDTTIGLWDYYYQVRVPYQLGRSKEDIKRFGTVIHGNPNIDKHTMKDWVNTELPIAHMLEYYRAGLHVYVRNPKDIETIYKAISDHIHVWKERLRVGVNIGDAPIQDLIDLDRFAHTIFEHARYNFTDDEANSMLARHFGNIQRINQHNFFNRPKAEIVNGENVKVESDGTVTINGNDTLPQRDSLGEFFKQRLMNLKR